MSKYITKYFVSEVSTKNINKTLESYDIVDGTFRLGSSITTNYQYVPNDTYITIAFEYYVLEDTKGKRILKVKE